MGRTQKNVPKGWGPKGWEGPTFRAFFPSPATMFFVSSSLEGPFVEFWWCLKRRGPEMFTFGVLGLSCEKGGGPVVWGPEVREAKKQKQQQKQRQRSGKQRQRQTRGVGARRSEGPKKKS